ncbi:MFS transporter [Fibrella sp. HMF5335]|uniref:MFS transporter n=1 Tax=Fibrella rubiginis TaxID=2817060 RepID=A0A939K6A1_9BACT|nr:MFS transporter [Fibrella rubiginis]MBO0938111.1 MFS transporter [Fibrella rubiginis]
MNTKIITRAIWLLSLVSLFADLASEMLYPIMPVYLQHIGFSVALIGLLEGVAEATAGLSKGYFGRLSDQWGRRLPFVRLGYMLSALSKPMMALFPLPGLVFSARTLDRLGKGLRTGARDALLADQSDRQTRGQVFGFHRSMDTLGGVLGPVAALIYLYFFPGQYTALFLLAFGPGLVSVGLTLLLNEPNRKQVAEQVMTSQSVVDQVNAKQKPASIFSFLHYWKESPPEYRRVVGGLLAFALFNSSDVFLLLKIKESGLTDSAVIGLYVFYNLVYAVMAYPVGRMADRLGLKPTLLVGLGLFALVYEGMVVANQFYLFIGLLGLYGIYAAATEGIAKAWISTISAPKDTATAIGTYAGLGSLCALGANALAGWLWYTFGAPVTFAVTGAATLAVIIYLVALEGKRDNVALQQQLRDVTDPDVIELENELTSHAPSTQKPTVTMTRSAFIAVVLLLFCLGTWTVYMSYRAVSATRVSASAASNATDRTMTEKETPLPKSNGYFGPKKPATPGPRAVPIPTGRLNSPSVAKGPVPVKPLSVSGLSAGLSAGEKLPKRAPLLPASNPAVRSAKPRRSPVRLYTLSSIYTHLYQRPDKRSDRQALVNLWKRVVLTPLAERNGFVFVVYTNKKGQRIRGWLPKRALRPLRLDTPLYSS